MTSVAEDKNSWAGQLNGQLLCFRRILQEAQVWRNKLAGEYKVLLGMGGGWGGVGGVRRLQQRPKGLEGEEEAAQGKDLNQRHCGQRKLAFQGRGRCR